MPKFWDFQDNTGQLFPTKTEMYPSPAPIATPAVHAPVAGARATVTVAGRPGYRHVCVGLVVSVAVGATPQTPLSVNLIDGASGGAAILASAVLAAPANQSQQVLIAGIAIQGAIGGAMTLEFSAAGVAASLEAVTLLYIDIKDA